MIFSCITAYTLCSYYDCIIDLHLVPVLVVSKQPYLDRTNATSPLPNAELVLPNDYADEEYITVPLWDVTVRNMRMCYESGVLSFNRVEDNAEFKVPVEYIPMLKSSGDEIIFEFDPKDFKMMRVFSKQKPKLRVVK